MAPCGAVSCLALACTWSSSSANFIQKIVFCLYADQVRMCTLRYVSCCHSYCTTFSCLPGGRGTHRQKQGSADQPSPAPMANHHPQINLSEVNRIMPQGVGEARQWTVRQAPVLSKTSHHLKPCKQRDL